MSIDVVRSLPDGTVIVVDTDDNREFALSAAGYAELRSRGSGRAVLDELIAANKTSGADPRTEAEQQAQQASEQGQGERHESEEEAR